jgi:predicted ATPase/class 3 adenylate cyclase
MSDPVDATTSTNALPTGTVTFVMTDIEGSTRLIQALGNRYPQLLAEHYGLLREAFSTAGVEVGSQGDALFYAFTDAPSAVRAALDAQRRLFEHRWPADVVVRVRMGIHSGEGRLLSGDYVGLDAHRTARITAAGHGGQVVLSDAARVLSEASLPPGATLRDLGEHRLKDLERVEHLFELVAPDLPTQFPPLRSAPGRPHNLPAQVTSFIGRTRELQQLVDLLRSGRLLTLTGPGGTGKTRLAVEVAAACVASFDGVHFVPLATITNPDLVIPTIATTFNLREGPARPVLDTLIGHLRQRTMLLVLDNFEQVIDAAPVVGELLAAAAQLTLLVTSRERLGIAGEQEFPVPPLRLPSGSTLGIEELRGVESLALFLQRASSVRPGFDLTPNNAVAVAEICERLDGLPLALELAAARVRLFQPHELLAHLDQRLSFLAGGRDRPERQRTLRGAIDWSHELLGEAERALFRRLSVFIGGCTPVAVEAVCQPGELGLEGVDGLSSLADKSLLHRDETVGELRMTMLETIHEYARERLEASGEKPEMAARHAAFFLDLAEEAAKHLRGPGQRPWLNTLDRELDNIRAVIRRAIDTGEPESGLQMAAALTQYWLARGHTKESRGYFEELLASPTQNMSSASRAAGLEAVAEIASWQGDYATMRPLTEEALARYRELGDARGIANQLGSLGYGAITTDPQAALELFGESIEAYRQAGSPSMISGSLVGLGVVQMRLGRLDDAVRSLEEAEQHLREAGDDDFHFAAIGMLGLVARLQGDLASARRNYAEVLSRSHQEGHQLGINMALSLLADLALLVGEPEQAAVLAVAAASLEEELGGTPSIELAGIPDPLTQARAELGDERYGAAVNRGRSMPIDEIVRLAFAGTADTPDTAPSGNI